jgi:hypothetical protein
MAKGSKASAPKMITQKIGNTKLRGKTIAKTVKVMSPKKVDLVVK